MPPKRQGNRYAEFVSCFRRGGSADKLDYDSDRQVGREEKECVDMQYARISRAG